MSQTTKRALEASLKHLLAKKPLDKITINDIAEDCGISRMTFYYHFKDIYDLIEWSCVEEASRVIEGNKTYDTWQEGFLHIFEAVLANKPFVMNVYHSVSREQIELILYQVTYDILIAVGEEKAVPCASAALLRCCVPIPRNGGLPFCAPMWSGWGWTGSKSSQERRSP